jgi:WD40 repeat protein
VYLAVDGKIAALDASDATRVATLLDTWKVIGFRVNGDGTRIAAASGGVTLFTLPGEGTGEPVAPEAEEPQWIRFSADGRLLGISAANGLWLWDVTTNALSARIESDSWMVEFNPRDETLVEQNSDGKLTRRRMDGTQLEVLGGGPEVSAHIAWSPDGRRLLAVGRDQTLHIWDVGD